MAETPFLSPVRIAPSGYYELACGTPFFPVGANYWPGSCGVEMWQSWPLDEIEEDLRLMAVNGLNCIRFFLRWQDFEPQPGQYCERSLQRLDTFLRLCARYRLLAQPCLFIGWMSGGLFWPQWKGGRNLYADPQVVQRSEAYARRIARSLRAHGATLLGVDLGNELDVIDESAQAQPSQVRAWCAAVTAAIAAELPGLPLSSGCDKGQIINDNGWRLGAGNQPGIDVLTVHGYPVPGWHPVACGGLSDTFTQSLLPFYTRCARSFGPVLVQEFGTIVPGESPRCDDYLRALLPACVRAGANGFLWWCLRDIGSRGHPYSKNDFEGNLGLLDASGSVKQGLRYYTEFARLFQSKGPSAFAAVAHADSAAGTALYWPDFYYARHQPENPGNAPEKTSSLLLVANHLLTQLSTGGQEPQVVRRQPDGSIPASVRTLVLPAICLTPAEIDALHAWVSAGGRLIWNSPAAGNWGPTQSRLIGASVADYHPPCPQHVTIGGVSYTFGRQDGAGGSIRLEVSETTATVLAKDQDGLPVLLRHPIGNNGGLVLTTLLPVEREACSDTSADRFAQPQAWYRLLLALASQGTH